MAAVRNDSGIPVKDIQVRLLDSRTGNSRNYRIRGSIEHSQQSSTRTRVVDDPAFYRVQVIAANPQ